ncbi:tyrosine-type recombinase/integrase [Pontiella sulfatireligans]|uniref:Defective protein IntQ n=1 Tax=Pontiella sulfatireligans TaxID=2750658 RepID=A0A6C2US70_9BACT|nr:site-specific integrase [Pontiella sulfatireligans]VGO23182.1 Putative defective protein IntQ [Pontiella sulfatireligans]
METEAKTKKAKTRSARGTGRLYKRTTDGKEFPPDNKTPGVFWIQYTLNGKRQRHALTGKDGKPITDLRQAEAERKRLTAPMRAGKREEQLEALTAALTQATSETAQAVEDAAPVLRVAEGWQAYLSSQDRPDTGERTLTDYAGIWRGFMDWLGEHTENIHSLRDITPQIAAAYAGSLTKGAASPNTFNKHTSFLKLFFRVLGEEAGLKANPFEKIRRKSIKTNSRRELTIAELKEILTKATGELQTLLALGTFTGLRLGDCCTLKWGEVDLDRGLIRRIPNKTAKSGKPVLVGIPAALFDVLATTPPSRRKGYVLPDYAAAYTHESAKSKATRRPEITKEIQAHFENCGIKTHKAGTGGDTKKRAVVEVGFHSLRHTYVSLHAEAGTPQAMIQGNVGHSNPAMTQHYLHVNEETAFKTAQVLQLEDPKPAALTVPDWIAEKLEGMTAKNWKQIKAEIMEAKA